jgi:homospermidine synthase
MEERIKKINTPSYAGTLPKNIRMIIIGYGSIGTPFLYMIFKWTKIKRENIIIMDKLEKIVPNGIKFIKLEINKKNYKEIINNMNLQKHDIIVDLAYNICTKSMLILCNKLNIFYINASWEMWLDEIKEETYCVAMDISNFEYIRKIFDKDSVTAFVCIGMNPGINDLFVSEALNFIDKSSISDAEKAEKLGLRVVHISELDTQKEYNPEPMKTRNTWGIYSFISEAFSKADIVLGSHEKFIPKYSTINKIENINLLSLKNNGYDTKMKSYVFDRKIIGKCIQHFEIYSIAKYLSFKNNFCPTVNYVYAHCSAIEESIMLLGENVSNPKILNHYNSQGSDNCGILLLFENGYSHWCGSLLDSNETRKTFQGFKHASPTSSQVVGGLIASLFFCYENSNRSLISTAELSINDRKFMMRIAEPLLGDIINKEVKYNPTSIQLTDFIEKKKKI